MMLEEVDVKCIMIISDLGPEILVLGLRKAHVSNEHNGMNRSLISKEDWL